MKHASLQQWLGYLEQIHPKTIDMGLARIAQVAAKGNLLSFTLPVVTVAGTNGKGSTVAALAMLLQASGKRVATYTSPHLMRFNERVQVNGQCVSDEQLCEAFEKIEQLRGQITLTFFEFTTLAAFAIFQKHSSELDILILEVGLGGRQDAVNLLSPTLAIITSIGHDHHEYLGETLESIAYEKAGILRQGIPLVLSQEAQQATLLDEAKELRNVLYVEEKDFSFNDGDWRFKDIVIKLTDIYLPQNSVSLAMAAYTILGELSFSLTPLCHASQSLQSMMMKGRFESCTLDNKLVIFDVAHNPPGSQWLANNLQRLSCKGNFIAVWSGLEDKDLFGIVGPLKEMVHVWYVGEVGQPRGATNEMLFNTLKRHGIDEICMFPTVGQAFQSAKAQAQPQDMIVVFGSFYVVSKVMETLPIGDNNFQNNGLFSVDLIGGATWTS